MKAFILILAFCACFVQIYGAEPDPNPTIDHLFGNATRMEFHVQRIETEFDLSKSNRDAGALKQLLEEIKSTKFELHYIREILQTLTESDHLYHFWERVVSQFISIQLAAQEETLNSIAFEILGFQSAIIADFTPRQISEKLKTEVEVCELKISKIKDDLVLVDRLIKKEFNQEVNQVTAAPGTKAKVHADLDKILEYSRVIREELSREYSAETQKVRYGKKHLNRIQKMKVERFIDLLYFVNEFLTDYKQVLDRLISF